MDMNMAATPTTTASALSAAATSATSSSAAVAMSMGDHTGCKVSMLLNWNTIDTCFLSSDWHNHTSLAFLATCLFSLLLVILLEGLRRGQRRFDQYLRDKHQFRQAREYAVTAECMNEEKIGEEDALVRTVVAAGGSGGWMVAKAWDGWGMVVLEQCSRAALYTAQFAVSYCIMLMFMYSNGFVITCIMFGAFIGHALFQRDTLHLDTDTEPKDTNCC